MNHNVQKSVLLMGQCLPAGRSLETSSIKQLCDEIATGYLGSQSSNLTLLEKAAQILHTHYQHSKESISSESKLY
ncbi:hypothetical protein TNCV_3112081 [Trichonephila clavipes]|nr:hypothetical protein TNCV_3112081 [Trichonephila clavipes]